MNELIINDLSYESIKDEIIQLLGGEIDFLDEDNLIELGLNSLQVMRLANKWRRHKIKVTFAELISVPNLKSWWDLISKSNLSNTKKTVEIKNEEEKEFPLTDVQYAYWIGRQEDQPLGGVGCHAYLELDGKGIDIDKLKVAWKNLFKYHPMLRAKFSESGMQEILEKPYSEEIIIHDLRLKSQSEVNKELKEIQDTLSHRLLKVQHGQVAGLEISLLPEEKYKIHFDIDLLVADVQSLKIIIRDLTSLYLGKSIPAENINWSFSKYLKENEVKGALEKKEAEQYWKKRIKHLATKPNLPIKISPEKIKKPIYKRRKYFIHKKEFKKLEGIGALNKVTPAMVLLTAYSEVINRWSTNSKFLINIPLFNRDIENSDIDEVVADFTNLLLLEIDCSGNKSFKELLEDIQKQFHKDVANSAYSGVQVQRDLASIREGERDFAPVVFACNLGNKLISDECEENLGKLTYMISQTPQVWIDFQSYDVKDGVMLCWDTVDELFPEGLIDSMFKAFTELIATLIENPKAWDNHIDVLPKDQKERRKKERLECLPSVSKCLHNSFFEYASIKPEKVALIDSLDNIEITYGELADKALRLASVLKDGGVKKGDKVAITLERGINQIVSVFAILALGACYVPISVEQPSHRRECIHKRIGIRYVISNEEVINKVKWSENIKIFDLEECRDKKALTTLEKVDPSLSAYIILTSGSTGEPKGVEITHYNAWNTIESINYMYHVTYRDRAIAVSALDFDLSVYDIFGLLSVGGSIVLLQEEVRKDSNYWLKNIQKYEVTIWNSVPILMDMLLIAAEGEKISDLPIRVAMLSGDWINLSIPERLNKVTENCTLVAMGGATEAAIWSNYFEVKLPLNKEWTSIPYGRPLPNQDYRIVDEDGNDCPDWVTGELYIGGAGVAKGYSGDKELTEEKFIKDKNIPWYKTGDLGRYWPDGNIEFLGRKDFQVKIRGHRIELGEIETALKKQKGVRDVVVMANLNNNKNLISYVVLDEIGKVNLYKTKDIDRENLNELWREFLSLEERDNIIENNETYENYIKNISIKYILKACKNFKSFNKTEFIYEDLLAEVSADYNDLIKEWLKILVKEKVLSKDNSNRYSLEQSIALKYEEVQIKENSSIIDYLEEVNRSSTGLLKGEINPLEIFYSDEKNLVPSTIINSNNEKFINSIKTAVEGLKGKEKIKILEVSARKIELTKEILKALENEEIEYTCTDNSSYFINKSKQLLKEYDNIEFKVLDINKTPIEQGFNEYSYDIVIALNSLHRCKNITVTLEYMNYLISPGGLLILDEVTKNSYLEYITVGFLEKGFNTYEDFRKDQKTPLISVDNWRKSIKESGFNDVCVLSYSNSAFGEKVILAKAPLKIRLFNEEFILENLKDKLPNYMIPNKVIPLKEIPLTGNGKVNRKLLTKLSGVHEENIEDKFVEAETAVEKSLVSMWKAIFSVEKISVLDNYFKIGGDSLTATKLITKIKEELEVSLSLGVIFNKPTIAELGKYIEEIKDKNAKDENDKMITIVPNPEDINKPFSLTDVQYAYWIGRSGVFELGNVSTHCYFELDGYDLNYDDLNKAWQKLINVHEMMRVIILPDGTQKILDNVPKYIIKRIDLTLENEDKINKTLKGIRDEMSHEVVSTDTWPLFDIRATYYRDKKVRIHVSFDNLIFDGWSMFYLLSEWAKLYREPKTELLKLDLSFRDYVLALEEIKKSKIYEEDKKYWLDKLDNIYPAPELPLAKKTKLVENQRFRRLSYRLSKEYWENLKLYSKEFGITPSTLLIAAYSEVLGRWSKTQKFTINLTQFNRIQMHPQVNSVVGDFTTLTLLSIDNSNGLSFLERVRNIQNQLLKDLDHSYFSGVEVQRELSKNNANNTNVIMPVVFTSGLGVSKWGEGEWLGKLSYNISQTPQVWLDHQVIEYDGKLVLNWDAVEELFYDGMLDDMFEAYCNILNKLASDKNVWKINKANLIEINKIEKLKEENNIEVPLNLECLHELVMKQAIKTPDNKAVITSKGSLSYKELINKAKSLGKELIDKGVQPNELVAVLMDKGEEQIIAILGILMSGAAYLPLDPTNPKDRLINILNNSKTNVILTQSWVQEKLDIFQDKDTISVDKYLFNEVDFDIEDRVYDSNNLAYVIYTSGSTGMPKGVMITHKGAANTILDINNRFDINGEDRIIALSNLNFDLSVYDVFGSLTTGAALVIPDKDKCKEPSHWVELINNNNISVWNTVPAFMEMLVEYIQKRNIQISQSMKVVLLSGDWIHLKLPDSIKKCFENAKVISLGGATEASIWSNCYEVEEIKYGWKSIPYGRPLVNQKYFILNDLKMDTPILVPGHLYIGGEGVAKGYLNDEEKTNTKFIKHPVTGERIYDTGDLGCYLPDGNIEFLGREDNQIKINGYRMEIGEIEAVMKGFKEVKESIVIAIKDSNENNSLISFIKFEEESDNTFFKEVSVEEEKYISLFNEIRSLIDIKEIKVESRKIKEFYEYVEEICFKAMLKTLRSMGVFLNKEEEYSLDQIINKCSLTDRYKTLVLNWLNLLVKNDVLTKGSEKYILKNSYEETYNNYIKLEEEDGLREKIKELEENIFRDIETYKKLLKGEINPLEILTENIDFLTPDKVYKYNITSKYTAEILKETFKFIVDNYYGNESKVLELGSRVSNNTEILSNISGKRDYIYSDESRYFIDKKKEEVKGINYKEFNFNKSPLEQGFKEHSIDIIVADNTLHRGKNIEKSLSYLKTLIAPGGFVIITEIIENSPLILNTVGFFEDGFSDLQDERKEKCLPLINKEKWMEILNKAGFENVCTCKKLEELNECILIAQAPRKVKNFEEELMIEALKTKLPDYMIPSTYKVIEDMPLTSNGKVDRKLLVNIAKEEKSNNDQVEEIKYTEAEEKIAELWRKVLNYDNPKVNDNFFKSGGDSLLAIKFINSMKESYDITLSLSCLFETSTIKELAEKFEDELLYSDNYEEGSI